MYFCLRKCFACAVTSARNVVLLGSHVAQLPWFIPVSVQMSSPRKGFSDYLMQNSIPLLLLCSSSPLFVFLHSTFFPFFFCFLGPHTAAYGRPRVESEPHLPAYATAPATPHLSRINDLHRSSRQSWILNPLSKARD